MFKFGSNSHSLLFCFVFLTWDCRLTTNTSKLASDLYPGCMKIETPLIFLFFSDSIVIRFLEDDEEKKIEL